MQCERCMYGVLRQDAMAERSVITKQSEVYNNNSIIQSVALNNLSKKCACCVYIPVCFYAIKS